MLIYRPKFTNYLLIAICVLMIFAFTLPTFAGLNHAYNSGGWNESQLVPNNYVSVCENTNTSVGPCYAALSTGGIDYLTQNNGAWASSNLVQGTTYVSIAEDAANGGWIYGARSDGGIDRISWNGSWQSTQLIAGNYTSVAGNLNSSLGGCYASRADGGIDWIHNTGGWIATAIVKGTTYKDIAEDPAHPGRLFGVRTDGGIDWINNSGGWSSTPLLNGNYVAVGANSDASSWSCYAARADGGIDKIWQNTGVWVADSVVTGTKYVSLCSDVTTNGAIYSATVTNAFPPLPQFFLGINQYSVQDPTTSNFDPNHPWSLSDTELGQLKADISMNTVRFPLSPNLVGLDNTLVTAWEHGEVWNESVANNWAKDFRGLDAVLDQLARYNLTPYICPGAEIPGNIPGVRDWETMYIPEAAARAAWFTKIVAQHVHDKYGDNVIYGWFENINNGYPYTYTNKYQSSALFPAAFRQKLNTMYGGNISALNAAWNTTYASFDQVVVPRLWDGTGVPESAYQSRQTYDLRKAMDLMSRDSLTVLRSDLAQIAPGAFWAGACQHDGFSGMYDARTVAPVRCTDSILTHAITSDALTVDCYQIPNVNKVAHRVMAKAASLQGKKYLSAETLAWSIAAINALQESGGALRGALLWAGKEDMCGLITGDGTRRESAITAAGNFFRTILNNPSTYSTYHPGSVRVYFPDETYEYMVLMGSHLDSYERLCDNLAAINLEPIFTSELNSLPAGVPIFVLERHIPRVAIDALNALGSRVVCPHSSFIDENGQVVARSYIPPDFYAQLNATPNGPSLLGAFQRVEEKERCVSFPDYGAVPSTPSMLAPHLPWAYFRSWDAIDGSHQSEMRFADINQSEQINIDLQQTRTVCGAYVYLFPGDIVGFPMSVPEGGVKLKISTDGTTWTEVANIASSNIITDMIHIRFNAISARYAKFDFGSNTNGAGTRILSLGLISQTNSTAPVANITFPVNGQHVRGSVEVLGTAAGDNFDHYQLSYATNSVPNNWVLINAVGNQVSNSSLGTWVTTSAADGSTTLKLYDESSPPDSNGASNSVSIVVDNTPPVITVLGENPTVITRNSAYTDSGASAVDQIDGNLSSQIQVTGTVKTDLSDIYTLTYNVSDSVGNAAMPKTRQVEVVVSIAVAKTMEDDTFVNCDNAVVTALFGDYYYVETRDRTNAIKVFSPGHGLSIGDVVRERGTIKTGLNGERFIEATGLTNVEPYNNL